MLTRLDHLVYATPDLEPRHRDHRQASRCTATPGGQHPGLGTRNALVALGPSSYLEIIGPDPEQPKPAGRRRFGIDELEAPRIVRWVAKGTELEKLGAAAAERGVKLGPVIPGSRRRPDGVVLSWRYTDPNTVAGRWPRAVLHRLGNVTPSIRDRGSRRLTRAGARRASRCRAHAAIARRARARPARAEGIVARASIATDRQPARARRTALAAFCDADALQAGAARDCRRRPRQLAQSR